MATSKHPLKNFQNCLQSIIVWQYPHYTNYTLPFTISTTTSQSSLFTKPWIICFKSPRYTSSHKFHPRKYIHSVKHHNIDYRHLESTTELDKISTSTGHYSRSNCGNMHAETTNHLTTQSMKTNNTRSNYLRQCIVEVPPLFLRDEEIFCSWGRCWRS